MSLIVNLIDRVEVLELSRREMEKKVVGDLSELVCQNFGVSGRCVFFHGTKELQASDSLTPILASSFPIFCNIISSVDSRRLKPTKAAAEDQTPRPWSQGQSLARVVHATNLYVNCSFAARPDPLPSTETERAPLQVRQPGLNKREFEEFITELQACEQRPMTRKDVECQTEQKQTPQLSIIKPPKKEPLKAPSKPTLFEKQLPAFALMTNKTSLDSKVMMKALQQQRKPSEGFDPALYSQAKAQENLKLTSECFVPKQTKQSQLNLAQIENEMLVTSHSSSEAEDEDDNASTGNMLGVKVSDKSNETFFKKSLDLKRRLIDRSQAVVPETPETNKAKSMMKIESGEGLEPLAFARPSESSARKSASVPLVEALSSQPFSPLEPGEVVNEKTSALNFEQLVLENIEKMPLLQQRLLLMNVPIRFKLIEIDEGSPSITDILEGQVVDIVKANSLKIKYSRNEEEAKEVVHNIEEFYQAWISKDKRSESGESGTHLKQQSFLFQKKLERENENLMKASSERKTNGPNHFMTELARQVSFYYSDKNLEKDDFILLHSNKQTGCMETSLLLTFPRIKKKTRNIKVLLQALKAYQEAPDCNYELVDDLWIRKKKN